MLKKLTLVVEVAALGLNFCVETTGFVLVRVVSFLTTDDDLADNLISPFGKGFFSVGFGAGAVLGLAGALEAADTFELRVLVGGGGFIAL